VQVKLLQKNINLSSSVSPSVVDGGLVKGLRGSAAVSSIAGSLLVSGLGGDGNIRRGVISSNGGGVGGGVAGLGVAGSRVGLTFGGDFLVQAVQTLGLGAVKVEPPVADEVVLVEDGAVGAEEAILGEAALSVSGANVENLALSLGIGVVSSVHLSVAGESGFGGFGVDGVVFTGDAGNSLLQHGKVVISSGGTGLVLALVRVSWLGVAGGRAGISGISGGRITGTVTATTGPLLAPATALSCGYSKEGKG